MLGSSLLSLALKSHLRGCQKGTAGARGEPNGFFFLVHVGNLLSPSHPVPAIPEFVLPVLVLDLALTTDEFLS